MYVLVRQFQGYTLKMYFIAFMSKRMILSFREFDTIYICSCYIYMLNLIEILYLILIYTFPSLKSLQTDKLIIILKFLFLNIDQHDQNIIKWTLNVWEHYLCRNGSNFSFPQKINFRGYLVPKYFLPKKGGGSVEAEGRVRARFPRQDCRGLLLVD